ncbi:MAG: cyclic nucleotide-binding domain-containing protein [Myxococcota bacterium]|nr:cyclic nucleotide-binding domain-containing protein [Myxococcota bacterium]
MAGWKVMDVSRLREIYLFKNLSERALGEVAALAFTEEFRRGERIFSENDPGNRFYLILSGEVRISKTILGIGEEALAILKPGNYFGEMALIDDAPRSADATADKPCVLSVITREDFEQLLLHNKDLAYELLWTFVRTLTKRLREMNEKMTFLATASKFDR